MLERPAGEVDGQEIRIFRNSLLVFFHLFDIPVRPKESPLQEFRLRAGEPHCERAGEIL